MERKRRLLQASRIGFCAAAYHWQAARIKEYPMSSSSPTLLRSLLLRNLVSKFPGKATPRMLSIALIRRQRNPRA